MTRRIPSWFVPALVYATSLGCLLWVYHDFDWKSELPRIARIHWGWILLAVCCDILVYISQAWRWTLLLQPVARLSLWRNVQAVYIGLFANEILPLRSGELIRCYLVAHWNRIPLATILGSALIERLVDGVWLILGFAAVAAAVKVPDEITGGAFALALLVAAVGAVVIFAVLNKRFARHVTTRHRWSAPLRTLIEGLHAMGRSRSFLAATLASMVYLGLQVIPIYSMIRGYGLDLSLGAAAIVLVILRLSTVVPSLPGNLGLFNIAAYTALHRILDVERSTAQSLSAVMFFIITVPLLLAGVVALAAAGLNLRELRRRAEAENG